MSDLEALLKGAGGDLQSGSEQDIEDSDDLAFKEKTKKVLYQAGPRAAQRLAEVSNHGDDKEAVSASNGILDRIGFNKGETAPARGSSSILPAQALIAALLGIGKVMGIRESELQQSRETIKGDFIEESKPSLLLTSVRNEPTASVLRDRVLREEKSKKIAPKLRKKGKA